MLYGAALAQVGLWKTPSESEVQPCRLQVVAYII